MEVSTESRVGQSGINLDGVGCFDHHFWVYDGVSPLLFRSKDRWKFRLFYRDKSYLDSSLEKMAKTDNFYSEKIFYQYKSIQNSAKHPIHNTPFYSMALLSLTSKNGKLSLNYSMYGDCGIIVGKQDESCLILNHSLEAQKLRSRAVFNIIKPLSYNREIHRLIKLTYFAGVRYLQNYLGILRVFGTRRFLPPKITGSCMVDRGDLILAFSDGATESLFAKDFSAEQYLRISEKMGLDGLVNEIRGSKLEKDSSSVVDDISFIRVRV